MNDLLKISDCAREMNVGEKTIRLYINNGMIPFKRLPLLRKSTIRIERKHWNEFLNSIKTVIVTGGSK